MYSKLHIDGGNTATYYPELIGRRLIVTSLSQLLGSVWALGAEELLSATSVLKKSCDCDYAPKGVAV